MSNAKQTGVPATVRSKTPSAKKSSRERSKKPRINSRQKGAQGEREFAELLRTYGYKAQRGQQHAGGSDVPDVRHDVPGIHFEVKRVQSGSPYKWLAQAILDAANQRDVSGSHNVCGNGKATALVPVVAHRRNGKDWIAILPMRDFLAFLDPKGSL